MKKVDELAVKTIRVLSADAIQKANSGHPGMPLGSAPMAYTLWSKNLKHNPSDPKWIDRDRFVLSAGHASMLLYSLLHIFGYNVTMEDIENFRQLGSKTPGHPEYGHTEGVEVTTGPLGQGIANAVGMAMAETYLANKFNKLGFKVVDHYTYALCGDGCLMEGISGEASSLAGTLGLGKLIVLYDSNSITIEGNTNIAFREDVGKRYEAYGWQVLKVDDGNDMDAIDEAIKEAKKETEKPTMIIVKTTIGYGCPNKQGTSAAHGSPLGEENIAAMKKSMNWNYPKFTVPDEVKEEIKNIRCSLQDKENSWNELFKNYRAKYPELASEWDVWFSDKLPVDLYKQKELFEFEKSNDSTRNSSGEMINRLTKLIPNLIGGSADLAPSNKTNIKGAGDFSKEDRSGRNLHFGIREHAMAAIANGMYAHGGLKIYIATFFVFSDYMKHGMRLAALMKLPVIYVLTHDSIAVGEDGPTHEPIEHLAALRSMPNMNVFRPCDAKETAAGWCMALTEKNTPTALILTRQNLPLLKETSLEALKGAYILKTYEEKGKKPDIILIGTGSEVQLVYKAAEALNDKGIKARVVSMPSWELFEKQSDEYKESIFPKDVRKRLAVEAASSFGWQKYVGIDGDVVSIDHFGASGNGDVLFKEFGFTVDNVVKHAELLLK